jgi:hypothetical protein
VPASRASAGTGRGGSVPSVEDSSTRSGRSGMKCEPVARWVPGVVKRICRAVPTTPRRVWRFRERVVALGAGIGQRGVLMRKQSPRSAHSGSSLLPPRSQSFQVFRRRNLGDLRLFAN